MSAKVLFSTCHGSRLYGLSHANSDYDYYTVTDAGSAKAHQSIKELDDTFTVGLGTWMEMCKKGVPQALEAMFSQKEEFDNIGFIRKNYVSGISATDTYLRTIKALCYDGTYKAKRHSLRLALNLYDLQRSGRFNPTLSPNEVDFVSDKANRDSDAVYATAMNIALDRLPPSMVR